VYIALLSFVFRHI